MDIPSGLLQHEIAVEPYLGTAGTGAPTYGSARTLAAFVDAGRKLVRDGAGESVVSEAIVFTLLEHEPLFPPKSRVTLPGGRRCFVILAKRRDGGSLPVPSHLEVSTT